MAEKDINEVELAIADHLTPLPPRPLNEITPEVRYFTPGGRITVVKYNQIIVPIPGLTKVIFIVHGFTNDIDTPWIKEMKNAIFSMKSDCVVGMVGWGRGAELHYLRPGHSYALTVGKWLAKHVKAYKDKGYETYGVGHSLGAHVMGIAGRNSQGKLDRISGLDPAGPCFETKNQENRLARTDAKFVDVIHTDGYYPHPYFPEAWICKHYGTLIPLGHMDFYPNYGYDQPGIGLHIAGSHERSYELFIWSITNPGKFRTQDLCRT